MFCYLLQVYREGNYPAHASLGPVMKIVEQIAEQGTS
jgi:hypothetical protein